MTFKNNQTCAATGCRNHVSGLHGFVLNGVYYGICVRCYNEHR